MDEQNLSNTQNIGLGTNNLNTNTGSEGLSQQFPPRQKKKIGPVLGGVVAIVLVTGVAVASYFVANQLSTRQQVAPNAPESKPQAAGGCTNNPSLCSKSEKCINGVCKKITTPAPYQCTSTNCPAPCFKCSTSTSCIGLPSVPGCGGVQATTTPKATVTTTPTASTITPCPVGKICATAGAGTGTPTPTPTPCPVGKICATAGAGTGTPAPQKCLYCVEGKCQAWTPVTSYPAPHSQCAGITAGTPNPTPTCAPGYVRNSSGTCVFLGTATGGVASPTPTCAPGYVRNSSGTCVFLGTATGGVASPTPTVPPCNPGTCRQVACPTWETPAIPARSCKTSHGETGICCVTKSTSGPIVTTAPTKGGGGGTSTPVPTKTGTPSVPTPTVGEGGACMEVKIYGQNANGTFKTTPMTQDEMNKIKIGSKVRLTVRATKANLKAKFKIQIDSEQAMERSSAGYINNDTKTVSYYDYEIPKAGNYKFQGYVSTLP